MSRISTSAMQVGSLVILCLLAYWLYRTLRRTTRRPGLIGLLLVLDLCALNHVGFGFFFHASYIEWFVDSGPVITLSFAIVAVVWDDLDVNTAPIDAHPARFIAGCLWVAAAFFKLVGIFSKSLGTLVQQIGASLREGRLADGRDSTKPVTALYGLGWMFGLLFETTASLFIAGLILLTAVSWCLVVAPLLYFVHLVSAAPARIALAARSDRLVITREQDGGLAFEVLPQSRSAPPGASEVSFTKRPFALTSALSAALLWIVQYGWQRVLAPQ